MEWADAIVWSTVLPNRSLAEDGWLRDRLFHIHLVQRAFLCVWRGEALEFGGSQELRGPGLAAWGREYHVAAREFLGSLSDADLDRGVHLPWAARAVGFDAKSGDPRLGETLVQVVSHSTYHRGQVNTRVRELGGEPPLPDYIAWLWGNRPGAAWVEGTGGARDSGSGR